MPESLEDTILKAETLIERLYGNSPRAKARAEKKLDAILEGEDDALTQKQLLELMRALEASAASADGGSSSAEPSCSATRKEEDDTRSSLILKLPGNVALELLPVASGTFAMGSPETEACRDANETQHRVTLTKPFWLGKTEVTQEQWQAVMGSNPSDPKGLELPVCNVSWDEALAFCRKLTTEARSSLAIPDGYEYRLPTEAEWEYACRAGSRSPYANDGRLDDLGWYLGHKKWNSDNDWEYTGNSDGRIHVVGEKTANDWGFHDMHGNVAEWCLDWYGGYPACNVSDPVGPDTGSTCVRRGGDWHSSNSGCRSACRDHADPGVRDVCLGFRIALAPVVQKDCNSPDVLNREADCIRRRDEESEAKRREAGAQLREAETLHQERCRVLAPAATTIEAMLAKTQSSLPNQIEYVKQEYYRLDNELESGECQMQELKSQESELDGKVKSSWFGGAFDGTARELEVCRQELQAWQMREDLRAELKTRLGVLKQQILLQPCPAGSFMMGSPEDEDDYRSSDETQHRVFLSPFWLGATPVTQEQWQALMGTAPSHFSGDDLPVENVSWDDAVSFCRKLTELAQAAGRLPSGYEYRLPTEAEWEYACRAGSVGPYAGTGRLDEMGWHDGNSGEETHPVAQKQPNAWGLYDMHGNVSEWCQDWYESYPPNAVTDPAGPATGADRVYRGGSWSNSAAFCRAANRIGFEPGLRDCSLGFRVALAPAIR